MTSRANSRTGGSPRANPRPKPRPKRPLAAPTRFPSGLGPDLAWHASFRPGQAGDDTPAEDPAASERLEVYREILDEGPPQNSPQIWRWLQPMRGIHTSLRRHRLAWRPVASRSPGAGGRSATNSGDSKAILRHRVETVPGLPSRYLPQQGERGGRSKRTSSS